MEFKKVVFGAFYMVNNYKERLCTALAIPFSIYVLIEACALLDLEPAITWLLSTIAIVAQAIFAITTHRIVLLGPDSVPKWGITSWSKRETYFILHIIGLGLMMIPIGLVGIIPVVGAIAALVLICWLLGRFSLVFPGIAVDKGVSFKLSWELTENHQLAMFLVVVIFPIMLGIPTVLFGLVPYGSFISAVFAAFVIVFEIAALSLAYQKITEVEYGES